MTLTSAAFALKAPVQRRWSPPFIPFFYLQTYPRAVQSPVEPWLYPPFPPALISNAIPQRVKLPDTSPHSQ